MWAAISLVLAGLFGLGVLRLKRTPLRVLCAMLIVPAVLSARPIVALDVCLPLIAAHWTARACGELAEADAEEPYVTASCVPRAADLALAADAYRAVEVERLRGVEAVDTRHALQVDRSVLTARSRLVGVRAPRAAGGASGPAALAAWASSGGSRRPPARVVAHERVVNRH